MPVIAISRAVTSPIFLISSGSRIAPRPMFCGKMVAPTMFACPWTASTPHIVGICSPDPLRPNSTAFQNASASFSHSAAGAFSFPPGALLPPARIEPNLYLRMSSGVTLEMSGWTVCATFSSIGIFARIASIRASCAGSSATRLCTLARHWDRQRAIGRRRGSSAAAAGASIGCARTGGARKERRRAAAPTRPLLEIRSIAILPACLVATAGAFEPTAMIALSLAMAVAVRKQ